MTSRALAVLFCGSFASALALGCSAGGGDLTELVVVVRADYAVSRLHVSATGPDGTTHADAQLPSPVFPVSMVLVRDHAPYGPVTIHVDGGDIAQDTITEFVPGARRRVEITLTTACACAMCAATETCRGGSCVDRHVAASDLTPWAPGADAGVERAHDGGGSGDVGPAPDGGPPCGCGGEPCCTGDTCHGTLSCRTSVCRDCVSTDPTITGTSVPSMRLTAMSATGDTIWVSVGGASGITQIPLALSGGLTANGTAPFSQLTGVSGSGNVITVRGTMGATASLTLLGATVSGSINAPSRPDGSEGWLATAVGSGHTIVLSAWDGTMGTLTFTPMEACR